MLANSNCFLDQVIKILWEVWGQSLGFKDSQNLVASYKANLGNTVGIPQNHSVTKRCLNPELIGKETGKYSNVYRGRERLSSRSGTRVPNPGVT